MRDRAKGRKDGTVAERSGSCGWVNAPLIRRRLSVLERLSRIAFVLVLTMPLLVLQHAEASTFHNALRCFVNLPSFALLDAASEVIQDEQTNKMRCSSLAT